MLAELRVEKGTTEAGTRFVIRLGQRMVIGRSGAAILLVDPAVSRQHAKLELREGGRLFIADLNSRNGTIVDGQRIDPYKPVAVKHGSAIDVGGHRLRASLTVIPDDETRKLEVPEKRPLVPQDDLRILGELGRGAHGFVYAAHQVLMDRRVALKVLRYVNEEEVQRFLQEARLACRVRSPHVVEVYDVRVVQGVIYMLMELVDGSSLHDRLRGERRLEIPEALSIGAQVALGLHAVHQEGVIHRDVKPSNILMCARGVAKLSDFGIAKELDEQAANLTPSGQGLGSLPYMAPEQVSGEGVDARSDLYGLGATLYRLLTGSPPFMAKGARTVVDIVETPPRPLRELLPGCPPDVDRLIMGLLEKRQSARPPTAQSASRQLTELRELCYPSWTHSPARTSQLRRTDVTESVELDLSTGEIDTGPPTPSSGLASATP